MTEHLGQCRRKLLDTNRLGNVTIHAGRQALFTVALHGVSRHGDDRYVTARTTFTVADQRGRLQAVQFGHLHIHKNEIKGLRFPRRNCRASIPCHCDLVSPLRQEAHREFLIGKAVLRQQNLQRTNRRKYSRQGRFLVAFDRSYSQHRHDGIEQFRLFDGLHQITGDVERLSTGDVSRSIARGEHDDQCRSQDRVAAHVLHQTEAVGLGHIDVGQHELERMARLGRRFEHRQRFGGPRCCGRLHPPVLEHFIEQPPIGGVVIDDQRARAKNPGRIARGIARHARGNDFKANGEVKRAPFSRFTLDPDPAPHQFDQPGRNGQPQSGSAVLSSHRRIGLLKGRENRPQFIWRDPDSRVAH